jgi:hypothetical protein
MSMPGFTASAAGPLSYSYGVYRGAGQTGPRSPGIVPQQSPRRAGCTSCFISSGTGPSGQTVFRGSRLCCVRVCVPLGGCRNHCWVESCNPFEGGGILV